MTNQIEAIAWGTREAMIAELAAWDPTQIGVTPKEARYLVMPIGAGQFDPEWFATKTEARNAAREQAAALNITTRFVA